MYENAKAAKEYAINNGFPNTQMYGNDGSNVPVGLALDGTIPSGYTEIS